MSTATLAAEIATTDRIDALAARIAPAVFRTEFYAPGFVLLDAGSDCDPRTFRAELVALGEALGHYYRRVHGDPLLFHSVSRFNQQRQTRPHRDGGPDGSVLVLGYEPSEVSSAISLMDYTHAAFDRGMTPTEFLDCYNPAFGGDPAMLRDYTTEVVDFNPSHYQILVINNSQLPYAQRQRGLLGVLHHAVIETPMAEKTRWINSLLLGVMEDGLSAEQLRTFVEDGTAAAR